MGSYYDSIEISASGLSAERLAMDVIANNIANANTTRTPQGGAFKRQLVVFAQKQTAPPNGVTQFDQSFNPFAAFDEESTTSSTSGGSGGGSGSGSGSDAQSGSDSDYTDPFDPTQPVKANVEGVQALGIINDPTPDRLVFDPGNPDADARGYVHYPNVEVVKEMVDLMAASRAYQANVAAITESRAMSNAATSILRS
jgi:flagellar basal-body rod protein FlgC